MTLGAEMRHRSYQDEALHQLNRSELLFQQCRSW